MKLKHDCVREVLLVIEKELDLNNVLENEVFENNISNFSNDDIEYSLRLLNEANYIVAEFTMDGYFVRRMTLKVMHYWIALETIPYGKKLNSVLKISVLSPFLYYNN